MKDLYRIEIVSTPDGVNLVVDDKISTFEAKQVTPLFMQQLLSSFLSRAFAETELARAERDG